MTQPTKQIFEHNEAFAPFRAQLKARGVRLAIVASGKIGLYKVATLNFTGDGFQPAVLSAMAVDQGDHGFEIYYSTKTNRIGDDVDLIVGTSALAKAGA